MKLKLYILTFGAIPLICTSSAMAVSYSIVEGDQSDVCQSVRRSLAEGMVMDAERPLCERRFQLSHRALSLGLSAIDETLLPTSGYRSLMRKILPVTGREKVPQSKADYDKNEAIIAKHLQSGDTKIYAARFDPDNSGKARKVYIVDTTLCSVAGTYWNGSVTTVIENDDGSLDRTWGVHDATAGIPFIYNKHTYYVKWTSLINSVNKNALAKLDVYGSVPYGRNLQGVNFYAVLTPSYCGIYQMK